MKDVDELIDRLDLEMAKGNRRVENRMRSLEATRLMLDRINDALTVLKRKPRDGELLYELIRLTYIDPEKYLFKENAMTIGYFNYDAIIDGTEILCFLDGDVTRLIRFKNSVMTNKIRYGIVCFPHQTKIIEEFFDFDTPLTVIPMEKVEKIISGEAK